MNLSQRWLAVKQVAIYHPWGARLKVFLDNIKYPVKVHKQCILSPKIISKGGGNSITLGFGSESTRNLTVEFRGCNNSVTIGDNVVFAQDCRIVMGADNGRIVIGSNSYIGAGTSFVVQENDRCIEVGEGYLGSTNVCLRTSDEHKLMDASGRRTNPPADVHIGRHVWLAHDVEVMKGVTIHDGSVIGAGSKVTKDIPANCLAVGCPARVIRTDVYWGH